VELSFLLEEPLERRGVLVETATLAVGHVLKKRLLLGGRKERLALVSRGKLSAGHLGRISAVPAR